MIISVFGVLALIFGSKSAIEEIIALYTTPTTVAEVVNAIVGNATTSN